MKKVCFIGLGSIASRHIRNLRDIYGCQVIIHVLRHSKKSNDFNEVNSSVDRVFYGRGEIDESYDAIFITNPTSEHYQTLKDCWNYSDNFFVEKPVFKTGNEDLSQFLETPKKNVYVACPLRYTNVIQYLKHNINFEDVYSIRCISSSYLPEWRPGMDYRNTYCAKKELGGGVSIDLIHEWDYIFYLIGKPQKVHSIISKKSNLEIDSDDIAIYIAEYIDKVVEVHLDYFGRETIRKIELFMKDETIEADLIKQTVSLKKQKKILELYEDRDSYQRKELEYFFDIIDGKFVNDNDIENASDILRLASGNL